MCIDLLIWAYKFKFYLKWKGTRKELMFSKPLCGGLEINNTWKPVKTTAGEKRQFPGNIFLWRAAGHQQKEVSFPWAFIYFFIFFSFFSF